MYKAYNAAKQVVCVGCNTPKVLSKGNYRKCKGYLLNVCNVCLNLHMHTFGYKCAYCGGKYEEVDHFHPFNPRDGVVGGDDTLSNLVPSCKKCNTSKSNRCPYNWLSYKYDNKHPMLQYGKY